MDRISIDEAKRRLLDLILETAPGGEVELLMGDEVVAKLVRVRREGPVRAESAKGSILYMAPDFDAPLEDFKDYME